MANSELDNIGTRLAIADAIIEAVRESGLLKLKKRGARGARKAGGVSRTSTPEQRAAAAERARLRRANEKKADAKAAKAKAAAKAKPANPLAKVPIEPDAAPAA